MTTTVAVPALRRSETLRADQTTQSSSGCCGASTGQPDTSTPRCHLDPSLGLDDLITQRQIAAAVRRLMEVTP